jgi:hypothetical protein
MTDVLPRHIADLCGLVFGQQSQPKPKPAKPYNNPIQLVKNSDGTLTLTRFKKTVGWINQVRLAGDRDGYKALSVHGEIKNCYSLRHAQDFLLSNYH